MTTASRPRRQRREPPAPWTHTLPIPHGHPLARIYAPGDTLMLAHHLPGAQLESGRRYLDKQGGVRRCLAGPSGQPFLVGSGKPARGDDEAGILWRIVGVVRDEDAPEAPANVVSLPCWTR